MVVNSSEGEDAERNEVPPERILGGWRDPDTGDFYMLDREMLLNQIINTSPEIAESFDRLCMQDMKQISELCVESLLYITTGSLAGSVNGDEVKTMCGSLLQNAVTSVAAGISLARTGFRLQPGIIVRVTIESLALVLHLAKHPEDLGRIRAGKFQSSSALAAAKEALPPLGHTYGFFSEQFAHVSSLHASLQSLEAYTERDEALMTNILGLKLTSWLIYVVSELTFHNLVEHPRYWQRVPEVGFAYNPSQQERKWFSEFFGDISTW